MQENKLQKIKQKLSEAGLKVTHQRMVILDALLEMDVHPTAEQVFDLLKPNNLSLSLGTVYKSLETMVEAGLVKKVNSIDKLMRYDAKTHAHHHLYLENTKEIIDFEDEELSELITSYLAKKNYTNLTIKGIHLHIHAEKSDLKKRISIN